MNKDKQLIHEKMLLLTCKHCSQMNRVIVSREVHAKCGTCSKKLR